MNDSNSECVSNSPDTSAGLLSMHGTKTRTHMYHRHCQMEEPMARLLSVEAALCLPVYLSVCPYVPASKPNGTPSADQEMVKPLRGSVVELCHAECSIACVKTCAVPRLTATGVGMWLA